MPEFPRSVDVPSRNPATPSDASHALAEVQNNQRAASDAKAAQPGADARQDGQQGKVAGQFGKVTITEPEVWGSRTFLVDNEGTAEYTVKTGDTLGRIAREVLMHRNPKAGEPRPDEIQAEVDRLAKDSRIGNPNLITPGEKIIVKAKPADAASKPEAPSAYHGEPVIKREGEKISKITRPDGDSVTITYTSGGSPLDICGKSGRYVKDDEGWKYTDGKTGSTTRYKDVKVDQDTGNIAITKLDGTIRTYSPEGATVVQSADKQKVSTIYPDNQTTEINYKNGQPVQIIEPDASQWHRQLDGRWAHFKNGELVDRSEVIRVEPSGDLRFEDKHGFGITRRSDRSTIETRADGSSIERAPDGLIRHMSHVDSQGKHRPVEVVYDAHRKVKEVTVMEGSWSKAGDSWKFIDKDGKETARADDLQVKPNGDIVIRDKGSVQTFALDGSKVTGTIQANGEQRITQVRYPDGKFHTIDYDPKSGQITSITLADGVRMERKGDHWQTTSTDPKKATEVWKGEISVTPDGDLVAVGETGHSVVRSRDGSKTVRNPDNTQVTADLKGRVTQIMYPDNHWNTMEYDKRDGSLKSIKNSETGSEWRHENDGWNKYDRNHQKVTHFDGQVTVSKDGDIVDVSKDGRTTVLKRNGKSEHRSHKSSA